MRSSRKLIPRTEILFLAASSCRRFTPPEADAGGNTRTTGSPAEMPQHLAATIVRVVVWPGAVLAHHQARSMARSATLCDVRKAPRQRKAPHV